MLLVLRQGVEGSGKAHYIHHDCVVCSAHTDVRVRDFQDSIGFMYICIRLRYSSPAIDTAESDHIPPYTGLSGFLRLPPEWWGVGIDRPKDRKG